MELEVASTDHGQAMAMARCHGLSIYASVTARDHGSHATTSDLHRYAAALWLQAGVSADG